MASLASLVPFVSRGAKFILRGTLITDKAPACHAVVSRFSLPPFNTSFVLPLLKGD